MAKETGSPKLLFENLDLTPIHSTLWTGLHRDGPGRPVVYSPVWDLKALMLRQLEQIPYIKDLVKRLRSNPYLRKACGYGDKTPCEAHFSQMKKRIGADGFRHRGLAQTGGVEAQEKPATGLIQAACIDGTDLPAWSSRDPHARAETEEKGWTYSWCFRGIRTFFTCNGDSSQSFRREEFPDYSGIFSSFLDIWEMCAIIENHQFRVL